MIFNNFHFVFCLEQEKFHVDITKKNIGDVNYTTHSFEAVISGSLKQTGKIQIKEVIPKIEAEFKKHFLENLQSHSFSSELIKKSLMQLNVNVKERSLKATSIEESKNFENPLMWINSKFEIMQNSNKKRQSLGSTNVLLASEAPEQFLLDVSAKENKEEAPNKEAFLNYEKFILKPTTRNSWKEFISELNVDQLQKLSQLFNALGQQVTEIWLNFSFETIWSSSEKNVKKCFNLMMKEASDEQRIQACKLSNHVKKTAKKLSDRVNACEDFDDHFDRVLTQMDSELIPVADRCIAAMEKAEKFNAVLLSRAFLCILKTFNDFNELTNSDLCKHDALLRAKKKAKIIDQMLKFVLSAMNKEMLAGESIENFSIQIQFLEKYLAFKFAQLQTKIEKNSSELLLSSSHFPLWLTAFGSNLKEPQFMLPNSFEDFLTFLDQTLKTIAASVEMRAGISISNLPPLLADLCENICTTINLNSGVSSPRMRQNIRPCPMIQGIAYNHPNIKITFNAPLRLHSAQFVIEGVVDAKGNLKSIVFEGSFFCPKKNKILAVFAVNSYYGDSPMQRPENFKFIPTKYAVRVRWQIFSIPDQDLKKSWKNGKGIIQKIIDYLQEKSNLSVDVDPICIEENPWIRKVACIDDEWRVAKKQ